MMNPFGKLEYQPSNYEPMGIVLRQKVQSNFETVKQKQWPCNGLTSHLRWCSLAAGVGANGSESIVPITRVMPVL